MSAHLAYKNCFKGHMENEVKFSLSVTDGAQSRVSSFYLNSEVGVVLPFAYHD